MTAMEYRGKFISASMRADWQLYLLVLPLLLWLATFLYAPMWGLQIAFKDYSLWKGIAPSPWAGLDNFMMLLENDHFLRAVANTFALAVLSLMFAFPVPIVLALMFNEVQHARLRGLAQTITYLPHFISVVIVAGLVIAMLSPSTGVVNGVRELAGLDRVYFLTRPEWFRPVFIGSNIWREAGFESIVYLAAIAGINPALYESARIDGASRWQMVWRITLPMLLPTVLVLLIIRIGNMVEVGFEYIVLLYQPSTYETADVIATFIYRAGVQQNQYALGTAAGLFNSLVALVLVAGANYLSRKVSKVSLW